MRRRRTFTRDFKLSILNELNVKSALEVCKNNDLHPTTVAKWKREFKENPEKAFNGNGNLWKAEAEVERYKRLLGELYAENEFLKKTTERLQQLKAEEEKMQHIK